MRTGRWLHALALPVALLAAFALPRQKGGTSRWAACGKGVGLWAASTLAGIALPAVLGWLRVLLTGNWPCLSLQLKGTKQTPQPFSVLLGRAQYAHTGMEEGWGVDIWAIYMPSGQNLTILTCSTHKLLHLAGRPIAWFGRPVLAFAMYLPAAFAGVLLPYALSLRPPNQAAGVHGAALAHAAMAAVMSLFGLKSGFAFALWAMAGVAGLLCPKEVTPLNHPTLHASLICPVSRTAALAASAPSACTSRKRWRHAVRAGAVRP